MQDDDLSVGFGNFKASYTDGKLKCEFSRERSVPGVKNYFDINQLYYLLFAHGNLDSSSIFLDLFSFDVAELKIFFI